MLKLVHLVIALVLALAGSGSWAGKPSTNKVPTVSLTAPAAGSTFAAPATITLTANAADSDGTIARVEFYQGNTLIGTRTATPYSVVWSNVPGGTHTLKAVAFDNLGAQATSALVTVSVTGPKVLVSSPPNGAVVDASAVVVTGSYVGDPGTGVWIDNGHSTRLATLSGSNFSATVPIFPGTNTLSISVARQDKTSDSGSHTVIRVDYPKLAFTAPTTGAVTQPANVTFAVDAISPTGGINRVTFSRGGTPLSTVTSPPYQYIWSNVPVGNHSVTAQAWDNLGYFSSASTTITVAGSNQLPTASLTASSSGAAPATITLVATASDSDGTISLVEFYQDAVLVGSTNVAPYRLVLSNMAAGSYSFTAKATDNGGSTALSPPVNVTVEQPSQSAITINSPTSGASYVSPAVINFSVTAPSNAQGVGFYRQVNGSNVFIANSPSTSSPYTYTWNQSTPGSYTVVARTTAFVDGFPTPFEFWSDPVTVTVVANPAGEIVYLHHDLAGSVIGATDVNGGVIWKEDYQPYGERINKEPAAAGNRQFYAGKALDAETGLSYVGARYYDPAVGRFMAIDPAGFAEHNLHSFNRFAYANNNPYRFVDPDGNSPIDVLFLAADVAKLGVAMYTGVGVGAAAADVAMSLIGVASPIPGTGQLLKGARLADKAVDGARAADAAKVAGETKNTIAGKLAHKKEPLPPGFERDVGIPGTKLRMDGYNKQTKEIIEIKPDNPRKIREGTRQADNYCKECDKSSLGPGHTARPVQTYDPSKYIE